MVVNNGDDPPPPDDDNNVTMQKSPGGSSAVVTFANPGDQNEVNGNDKGTETQRWKNCQIW